MQPRSASRLALAAGLLLALGWSLLLGNWHLEGRASLLDRVESVALDLRFLAVGRRPPPPDLVIVAIDDEAVAEASAYPLPRPALVEVLRALAGQEPAAVALDLLLIENQPETDAALAQALTDLPIVVAAAGLFDAAGDATPLSFVPRVSRIVWPAEAVRYAAEAGLVNVSSDSGGTPRHLPLLYRSPEGLVPSFALLAAALAWQSDPSFADDALTLAGRRQPLDLGYHLPLNFYGPHGTLPIISAARLLRGDLPPRLLRGQVVVVGATAVGSGDTFATPFSPIMPGVEVLATAIGNLMTADGLIRTPTIRGLDAGAATLLALLAVVLITLRRTLAGLLSATLLAAAWVAFAFVAFFQGYWFSISLPLAAMLPVAALYGGALLGLDRYRIAQLSRAERGLRALQPPAVARRLAKDPDFLARPLQQDAAVLFIDLSGFTGASEALGAARTRDLLKAFHSLVDEEINRHGGLVTVFMGDGAMALFGFPDAAPDDAARALAAALSLRRGVEAWGRQEAMLPGGPLTVRLGVHYGPVVLSRLGGRSHQHITATGDTVNVTSRLLDVAKQRFTALVVTEALFQAATATAPDLTAGFSPPADHPIRGRRQTVTLRSLSE